MMRPHFPVRQVTETEVIECVVTAFFTGPATRHDLHQAAISNNARPEVIEVIRELVDRRYDSALDLGRELGDLPFDVDTYTATDSATQR